MKLHFYDHIENREVVLQIRNSEMEYWLGVIEDYNILYDDRAGIRPLEFTHKEEILIGRNK